VYSIEEEDSHEEDAELIEFFVKRLDFVAMNAEQVVLLRSAVR
jgi:hypothetical protein